MIKINRADIDRFFAAISEKMPLFLPVKKAGEVNFGAYEEGAEVSLDTLKTVKSAKDFFFPQSETMMKFKKDGKNLEIID
ncbi:MAG: 4Fe-4S ferredoxin, partial [Clostridia bacterium]|nr:4Fe-4S ferredoxin [Clostridia bacterium]